MRLVPWTPTDAHAVSLVQLVTRAEAKALDVLRAEMRADGLNSESPGWAERANAPGALDRLTALVPHAVPAAGVGDLPLREPTPRTKKHVDSLESTMARVRTTLERWLSPSMVAEVVTATGERARAASERHWSGQVSRAAGQTMATDTTPGRDLLQAWIADNTARIQGLRNETLGRIRDDLETAVLSDVRPAELVAKWEREGLPTLNGTMRGRAVVIARHQLGLLAAQMAEHQQKALGVDDYEWDPRPAVPRKHRRVHLNRAGARYKWDAPPPGGHPGTDVGCGCRAVAVVDAGTLRRRMR